MKNIDPLSGQPRQPGSQSAVENLPPELKSEMTVTIIDPPAKSRNPDRQPHYLGFLDIRPACAEILRDIEPKIRGDIAELRKLAAEDDNLTMLKAEFGVTSVIANFKKQRLSFANEVRAAGSRAIEKLRQEDGWRCQELLEEASDKRQSVNDARRKVRADAQAIALKICERFERSAKKMVEKLESEEREESIRLRGVFHPSLRLQAFAQITWRPRQVCETGFVMSPRALADTFAINV